MLKTLLIASQKLFIFLMLRRRRACLNGADTLVNFRGYRLKTAAAKLGTREFHIRDPLRPLVLNGKRNDCHSDAGGGCFLGDKGQQ